MLILTLIAVLSIPTGVLAAEFGPALSMSMANVSPGADVAGMGNCWSALPGFSSNNPAVIPAGEKSRFGGSYTFGLIMFKRGPNATIHQGSANATLPKGTLQLTLTNASSGLSGTAMDVDMKSAHAPSVELMYGLQAAENIFLAGDKFFIGAGGSLAMSQMKFSQLGQNVAISRSRGFEARCGFLYQPAEGVNFGGTYSYSRDRNDDRESLFYEEDGSSLGWNSRRSNSDLHQVRLGISWQVHPRVLLAADYQYLNCGHLKRDQLFAGAELMLVKDRLYAYGGWASSGPTAGIGVYFKNGGLNVAYQNNTLNDLTPHLGRSQTVMATVYLTF